MASISLMIIWEVPRLGDGGEMKGSVDLGFLHGHWVHIAGGDESLI